MIDADPRTVFAVIADPHRHHEVDGSGTVLGQARGPRQLQVGSIFSMGMRQSRARYRSLNRVLELEPDRSITWETVGEWKGHRFIGGQRWHYRLIPQEPADGTDGPSTLVVHTYDWGAALAAPVLRLLGYPRRAAPSMARTLQRLADVVSTR